MMNPAQMYRYVAEAFGWMIVLEAENARVALTLAKQAASSASLLSTDVTSVRPATDEDVAWYEAMGGGR